MIKSKDLPMFVLVVGVAAIASYFLSSFLFGRTGERTTKVEVVDAVSSTFNYEDKPYYAPNPVDPSILPLNPTKDITVDVNNNTDPLGQ